jgi:acyl carrier protein phosphodiesterase
MNWLAHLLLTGPSQAARIGGILPDFAKPPELKSLAPEFQSGIRLHYQIDAFTDSHEVFKRSIRRIEPPVRRYGGIIVDVFYDHFLSVSWHLYSEQTLEDFVKEVYASFEGCRGHIPHSIMERLKQMEAANWLYSYRDLDGVRLTLNRISTRLRRPMYLGAGVDDLERHYEDFRDDFISYFPQLQKFVHS